MLIRVIAVGTRMPDWVRTAVDDYTRRLPADFRVEWKEVRAETRGGSGAPEVWMEREAQRIRAQLPAGARLVVLDEHGRDLDTAQWAERMGRWRDDSRPVALLIGGPDGLHGPLKREAAESLRLSSLTLAHPLVRVVLAEQLFRGWSILANHPYHRS
ncbi:MAG TPA: 23S rRNA (pseudouridine(1915)-N(3))-methyltransferase RlmH [Burkholderiaceae bacterium]|nr:23S rRNA (pseudouridine(1915)-N(3))-methyltransferase RlmH [Burkholderiaceae bacterium]